VAWQGQEVVSQSSNIAGCIFDCRVEASREIMRTWLQINGNLQHAFPYGPFLTETDTGCLLLCGASGELRASAGFFEILRDAVQFCVVCMHKFVN